MVTAYLDNTEMFDAMAKSPTLHPKVGAIAALDPSFVEEPPTFEFERVSIYTDSEDLGFEGTALPDMLASISEGISKLLEASAEEGKPVRSVILEAVTCADEPGRAQIFAHLLR
jgi:hypothetical protein